MGSKSVSTEDRECCSLLAKYQSWLNLLFEEAVPGTGDPTMSCERSETDIAVTFVRECAERTSFLCGRLREEGWGSLFTATRSRDPN